MVHINLFVSWISDNKFIPPQTCSIADTNALIAAISGGKGLRREEIVTTTVIGPVRAGVAGVRISGAAAQQSHQMNMGRYKLNKMLYLL